MFANEVSYKDFKPSLVYVDFSDIERLIDIRVKSFLEGVIQKVFDTCVICADTLDIERGDRCAVLGIIYYLYNSL